MNDWCVCGELGSPEHLVFTCARADPNILSPLEEFITDNMDEILAGPRKRAILYKLTYHVSRAKLDMFVTRN